MRGGAYRRSRQRWSVVFDGTSGMARCRSQRDKALGAGRLSEALPAAGTKRREP